ncbi:MAG: hypothetical protein ACPGYX_11435 [Oceanobacter sp.]
MNAWLKFSKSEYQLSETGNGSWSKLGRRRLRLTWASLIVLAMVSSWSLTSPAYAAGFSWSRDMAVAPDTGTGSSFAASEMELVLPISDLNFKHESLEVDFRLTQTEFDWVGSDAAENDYYWLALPLRYRQRQYENDEFRIDLEPGFMSDPSGIGTDRIAANLAVTWRHFVRPGFFWQVGVMVDRRLGDFSPRPTAGMAWHGGEATEVLLGFPETRVQTRWQPGFSTYLHIRPEGGIWKETITGLDGSYRLDYHNWKAGVGAELFWRGQLWFNAELGTQKVRQIQAYDSTGTRVKALPAQAGYWLLGVLWRW